jgi:predicted metal-dependent RNase
MGDLGFYYTHRFRGFSAVWGFWGLFGPILFGFGFFLCVAYTPTSIHFHTQLLRQNYIISHLKLKKKTLYNNKTIKIKIIVIINFDDMLDVSHQLDLY